MSHELRTPLNAIDGYAELLELEVRGPITEAQRDDIRRIRRSQKHLLSLINDVLNFVRLDVGHGALRDPRVRAGRCDRGVEDVTAPQLRARSSSRFVRRNCDARRRACAADREKVEQILVNLMTNAIKFTEPTGRDHARVRGARRSRDGSRARHRVAASRRTSSSVIFEPFVQVARSAARAERGRRARARDQPRAVARDGRRSHG